MAKNSPLREQAAESLCSKTLIIMIQCIDYRNGSN